MDQVSIVNGAITLDLAQDHAFEVVLSANITAINLTNVASYPGKRLEVYFAQDSTGGRTVAGWPASVKLAGNAFTVTSAAGKRDSISFRRLYTSAVFVENGRAQNCPA